MRNNQKKWPPGGLTGWMATRVVPAGAEPGSTESRTRLGEFEGYVSTAISLVLAALKAALGLATGSIALIADAANNGMDILSSLFIALACRWARKPRDREHPFGHGRAETVATLVLSICLILVAIEVAKAGAGRLIARTPVEAPLWIVGIVGVAVLVKSWLARFAYVLARATRSEVLEADAWNHIFDIASSALVVAGLVGAHIGWPVVDAVAALGVSGFIGWTGFKFARRAVDTLIGAAPDAADTARISAIARRIDGVQGIHDLVIHAYGDRKLVSLHIEVDAGMTLTAAHELAERVEAAIADELDFRTVAHVDPVDRNHPAYAQAEAELQRIIADHPELREFHDLRLTGFGDTFDLSVDLVADSRVLSGQFPRLLDELKDLLRRHLPNTRRIDLGIENELASEHEKRKTFHE